MAPKCCSGALLAVAVCPPCGVQDALTLPPSRSPNSFPPPELDMVEAAKQIFPESKTLEERRRTARGTSEAADASAAQPAVPAPPPYEDAFAKLQDARDEMRHLVELLRMLEVNKTLTSVRIEPAESTSAHRIEQLAAFQKRREMERATDRLRAGAALLSSHIKIDNRTCSDLRELSSQWRLMQPFGRTCF